MYNYLKHVRNELNKLTFQSQALAWFVSFQLSGLILSDMDNVGSSLFNIILQFFLSMVILTAGVWVSDIILKNRYENKE